MEKCVHAYVKGDVMNGQYRIQMKRLARKNGIRGWARPLVDGRVEAVLKGRAEAVDEMLNEMEAASLTGRARKSDRDGELVQRLETRELDRNEVEGLGGFKLLHGARLSPSGIGLEVAECESVQDKGRSWLRCRVYGYEPLEPRHCEECGGEGEALLGSE